MAGRPTGRQSLKRRDFRMRLGDQETGRVIEHAYPDEQLVMSR